MELINSSVTLLSNDIEDDLLLLKLDINNSIDSNISKINKSKVDVLFVCLGCPKQELWMHEHKKNLKCIMIGIGAVADFLSGNKILPNKFFEYLGLAWLIRLITEPRRLFWRYFSTNFLFLFLQLS